MKRRMALRYAAYGAAGASLVPSFIRCRSDVAGSAPDTFFDPSQYEFITSICDALLPESDTPGAVELGVPAFFDHMVGKVFDPDDRSAFVDDLTKLQSYIDQKSEGNSFTEMSNEDRTALLAKLEAAWKDADEEDIAERSAYYSIRGQVISYYLCTQYVAINLLNYLPVPGEYEACIPLTEAGDKAWAI